ncbi:maleylpyruvate isomerase family mycothiol-dependent enzyme [Streptomyces chiangmaiensis]
MSLHPTLQPYADAWTHSIEAISELVQPLVDGEWNRRTPCPGWSVRDVVSHVIGMDCEMLGDPRPIHTLPRDLFHVTNEHQRYMEMQVDVRRHHTAPEMTSELEYTIIRRNRQLRNETRDPDSKVRGPLGTEQTLEEAMRYRAFDVWVHEQDLRAALGRPGNLDSPGAYIARDELLAALPKVVAEHAGAPPVRRPSSTSTAPSSSCGRSGSTRRAAAGSTARPRWARRCRSRSTGRPTSASPAAASPRTSWRTASRRRGTRNSRRRSSWRSP